jgi:hypothetical protein
MKEKFNTWKHYIDTFLNQLLDKNTEALFDTFYLYINGNAIRNMLQKLRDLTWDNLNSLLSDDLNNIHRLINYKENTTGKHSPIPFLRINTKEGIVNIQHCKVLMSCSVSEIISDNVLHLNNDGHIKSCYSSKLSQEELKIAHVHGEVVDRWFDLIFVMMNIQLSFFFENRKGAETENWNPPASTQILPYFQKTKQYFEGKWKSTQKNNTDAFMISEFGKKQKHLMKTLISDEWKRYTSNWKPTEDNINIFELYTKRINSDEILLKCDLKLFLWTVMSKEVYSIVKPLGSMADYMKTEIIAIFNAAINNQIAHAEKMNFIFTNQMKIKTVNNAGAPAAKTMFSHMDFIINVCRELYRLPDFTSIQDLSLMYMSEGLNRIHMGPVH